jgi:hypothetical protein
MGARVKAVLRPRAQSPLEEEELFVTRIQNANAVVTYYVVTWELLIIVKHIDSG